MESATVDYVWRKVRISLYDDDDETVIHSGVVGDGEGICQLNSYGF